MILGIKKTQGEHKMTTTFKKEQKKSINRIINKLLENSKSTNK